MFPISWLYSITSRVAAAVLLVAGGLKLHELFSTIPTTATASGAVLTGLELVFGLWLMIGLYPRWTRVVALAYFAVLLNVALAGILQGRGSCGCFGSVSVRPWGAAALDALMFAGLLFSPPLRTDEPPRGVRIRWLAFAIPAILTLLVVAWPLTTGPQITARTVSMQAEDNTLTKIDESALQRVIQGVERNHAAINSLVCAVERMQTVHAVETPLSMSRPVWNGRHVVTGAEAAALAKKIGTKLLEKTSRHPYTTWIRENEVRIDFLTDGAILLAGQGKIIQYAPDLGRALISSAEFVDAGHVNAIDLRCAGFEPPLKSIAEWLNRCKVFGVGVVKNPSDGDVVRVHARIKKGAIEDDVTAYFVPELNYMPTRVIYKFLPNGGIRTVTDIEYQPADSSGAWIPRKIVQRSFFRNTTSDPDVQSGQIVSQQDTVTVKAVGKGTADEVFDPILPPNTILVGDLPTQSRSGDVPVRVSKVVGRDSGHIKPRELRQQESVASQRRRWPLLAAMDFLLVAVCLRFRDRFAF